jgi:hypothetical protein
MRRKDGQYQGGRRPDERKNVRKAIANGLLSF